MGLRAFAAAVTVIALMGCADDSTPGADAPTGDRTCESMATDERSVARIWNEAALDAVRRDFPAPTVHARNLFHLSVAMWDTWAAFEPDATGHLVDTTTDLAVSERADAVNAAAHRLLMARYDLAVGAGASLNQFDETVYDLCGDPTGTELSEAARFGIDIADEILAATAGDGAGADIGYEPVNPSLQVQLAYTSMADPNRWQPLELERQITQNGQEQSGTVQVFVSPEWGSVTPFALDATNAPLPLDPGPPPLLTLAEPGQDLQDTTVNAAFIDAAVEVIEFSAVLDPENSPSIDIGPATRGNATTGTNDGTGHEMNPATSAAYAPNMASEADFGRVVAEFWADGPDSETPPGHWNTLANEVSDQLAAIDGLRVGGTEPVADRLEWDLKLYVALNGATHDGAIAAWGAKTHYDYSRPISMIRYLAGLGQSSDPEQPSYHPAGLPLIDDLIRVGAGDEIEIRAWTGVDGGGVDWIRAGEWVPYQLETFVTPSFAGYVSGHSVFSRAAAEILTAFTGDPYFPGGLGEWRIEADSLVFDTGPADPVTSSGRPIATPPIRPGSAGSTAASTWRPTTSRAG